MEIYTPYVGTVLYNMFGTGLSREDTEEVVSDVFVSLWENAGYIDLQKGTLRSYIAATARNYALKKISRKKQYISINDIEITDERDIYEEGAYSEFLWKTVMTLGEPDNEIFVRYYKYGEKLKDISKKTGLNLSTVKSKLSRGKRKLKKILSDSEESL